MQLTIRILGCEILHINLSDSPAPEPEPDAVRDLSGGYLGSTSVEAGSTDLYLGFTNGRGDE